MCSDFFYLASHLHHRLDSRQTEPCEKHDERTGNGQHNLNIFPDRRSTYPAVHITPAYICKPVYAPFHLVISSPPIGLLIKAAMDIMAKTVPVRTPIWRTSDICASIEGKRDTNAPLPKPKSAAKRIIGALPVAGSHNASVMIPFKSCQRQGQCYTSKEDRPTVNTPKSNRENGQQMPSTDTTWSL